MPLTPAELDAYRRRFEAARSFEDDDEWFKEPPSTTNTPIFTANPVNKPVLKPTAQKWSFQGIQPPAGPKKMKGVMESGGTKNGLKTGGAVQYPRSGLSNGTMGNGAGKHGRVDSRLSGSETDLESQDGEGEVKRR